MQSSPISILTPMLHIHRYHRHYTILAKDSVVKITYSKNSYKSSPFHSPPFDLINTRCREHIQSRLEHNFSLPLNTSTPLGPNIFNQCISLMMTNSFVSTWPLPPGDNPIAVNKYYCIKQVQNTFCTSLL